MPTVPTVTAPTVAPTPSTGIPYQNANGATPEAFGAGIGEAEQGLGAQLEKTSDVIAKHTLKLQEDMNVSHSEELFLKGDTALSTLTNTYKSLQGADRVNALPQFMDDAAKIRKDLLAVAPNNDVARRFDQLFTRQLGYSIKDAGTAAASATRQYQSEQKVAVQKSSLNHIAEDPNDDKRFETQLEAGLEAVRGAEDYKGSAPEVRDQHDQAFISSAWSTRLTVMAKNDPLRARELFNKNKDSIDGITQLKLDSVIKDGIVNGQSRVDSDEILQSGALVSPELKERIKKFEGYKDTAYPDGRQTSIGFGTKAQPGDDKIPAADRKAVFEQRMVNELSKAANIVDTFAPGLPSGTRDALISLTYNAGPGWTTSGLGGKIRAGDFEGAKTNFSQYTTNSATGAPDPVLAGRRQIELSWWGGEASDTGLDSDTRLSKALDRAKERAAQLFPDDPTYRAKYLDTLQNRLKTDSTVLASAARDMQLQVKNQVTSELITPLQSGKLPTSYNDLSPKGQQAYDLASPSQQQVFQRTFRSNASQDVPLTNERQSRFDTLRGEMINQPDKGMERNIVDEDLTRVQKSQLIKMQQDKKALVERGVKLSTAMQAVGPILNEAGIVQSRSDPVKQAEYNKVSGMMDKLVQQFELEHKKPPNDAEIRKMGAGLVKDVVLDPGWSFIPFTGDTRKAYQLEVRAGSEAADYAKIPSGSLFRHPDGSIRKKP